mmetsp:Transcript_2217/g.3369  ORF Transcript_2217/g.3369 Transcript_2217/m.3369 type:complete len:537 (-) Transcript_2217:136-1746(-)
MKYDSSRRRSRLVAAMALSTSAVTLAFSPMHQSIKSLKRKLPTPTSTSLFVLGEPKPKTDIFGLTSIGNAMKGNRQGKQLPHVEEETNSFEEMMKYRTDFEMTVMSTLAITVPAGVILSLAMGSEDSPRLTEEISAFSRDLFSLTSGNDASLTLLTEGSELLEDSIEQLGTISSTVFDAAVSTSPTDIISVALGEGIAASIGGAITFLGSIEFKTKGFLQQGLDNVGIGNDSNSTAVKNEASVDGFIAGAVADTDYFITRAAAVPILAGFGLPPILGVIVATIPSQLIKLSARQRQQRRREDDLLQALLLEEKTKKNRPIFSPRRYQASQDSPESTMMESAPGSANQADFVEIFSDITRWLEYDVLIKEFHGFITWNNVPIFSGLESAIYGLMAALSSQLWADAIYRFSDYGLEENREAARSRTVKDTISLYQLKCFTAATLFGVYETARLPISNFITSFLSGGVDGCLGSSDFALCLETFVMANPASATVEGQARAFFVTAANIIQKLDGFSFSSGDNFQEDFRGLAVQLYSIFS